MTKPGMFSNWGDAAGLAGWSLLAVASFLGIVALFIYAVWFPLSIGIGAMGVVFWRQSGREGGASMWWGRAVATGVWYWAASIMVGGIGRVM